MLLPRWSLLIGSVILIGTSAQASLTCKMFFQPSLVSVVNQLSDPNLAPDAAKLEFITQMHLQASLTQSVAQAEKIHMVAAESSVVIPRGPGYQSMNSGYHFYAVGTKNQLATFHQKIIELWPEFSLYSQLLGRFEPPLRLNFVKAPMTIPVAFQQKQILEILQTATDEVRASQEPQIINDLAFGRFIYVVPNATVMRLQDSIEDRKLRDVITINTVPQLVARWENLNESISNSKVQIVLGAQRTATNGIVLMGNEDFSSLQRARTNLISRNEGPPEELYSPQLLNIFATAEQERKGLSLFALPMPSSAPSTPDEPSSNGFVPRMPQSKFYGGGARQFLDSDEYVLRLSYGFSELPYVVVLKTNALQKLTIEESLTLYRSAVAQLPFPTPPEVESFLRLYITSSGHNPLLAAARLPIDLLARTGHHILKQVANSATGPRIIFDSAHPEQPDVLLLFPVPVEVDEPLEEEATSTPEVTEPASDSFDVPAAPSTVVPLPANDPSPRRRATRSRQAEKPQPFIVIAGKESAPHDQGELAPINQKIVEKLFATSENKQSGQEIAGLISFAPEIVSDLRELEDRNQLQILTDKLVRLADGGVEYLRTFRPYAPVRGVIDMPLARKWGVLLREYHIGQQVRIAVVAVGPYTKLLNQKDVYKRQIERRLENFLK